MKKDDRLIEELLKEHGRGGADEKFLTDVDERLDAEGKVVNIRQEPSAGNRWALGVGVAACLALGVGGISWWQGQGGDEDIVAYETAAPGRQLEVALNESGSTVSEEIMIKKREVKKKENKPASPSPSQVKDVVLNSAGQINSPMRDEGRDEGAFSNSPKSAEEALLSFEGWQSFGDGFGSDSSRRNQKAKNKSASMKLGRSTSIDLDGESRVSEYKRGKGLGEGKKLDDVMDKEIRRDRISPKPSKPLVRSERYGRLIENKFKAPVDEHSALSTFAVDVDTASYANVRRMLGQRLVIPKDSVRIEEMVNYFDYEYGQPKDEHPFSVNVDSMVCPWDEGNRLVRIGVQGKEVIREERPAANLVFLLDVSGSMNNSTKLPLLKKSMEFLLEELNEKDSISIVVYAGASGLALPATKMDAEGQRKVAEAMDKLSAGGSTAGGQGIKLAYKVAKEQFVKGGVNRIILGTDGDFNVGVSSDDALIKMVKKRAKEGTYLSVLGFGSGNINDSMLEKITNSGNGNYSYIDSLKEGRKVLLEDMMGTLVTIAKDVKVQVVMNPNKVKAYRLIGYSNRMLPPEAFLDKKVDAGEIGAGHTVTALYEVIPADGKPFGPEIDAGRYFEVPKAKVNPAVKDSDEMMFVKLAYKQPDEKVNDESTYLSVPFTDQSERWKNSSTDLKFASAVGLFGMVLRDSEFKGKGDLNMVLELANAGKGTDGKGQRDEFIEMVKSLKERE